MATLLHNDLPRLILELRPAGIGVFLNQEAAFQISFPQN